MCIRDRVWGYDYFGDSRLVDVHIRRLRMKIEPDAANPIFLVTVSYTHLDVYKRQVMTYPPMTTWANAVIDALPKNWAMVCFSSLT